MIRSDGLKIKQAKKTARIFIAVDGTYAVLIVIGILIGGLNHGNPIFVGWTLVTLGILTIPVATFHICMNAKGWSSPSRWPSQLQDKKQERFEDGIACAVLVFWAALLLILGAIMLTGIIGGLTV